MILCAICYHLHNLKNEKSTYGGVMLLIQLQASATFLEVLFFYECFSRFLYCTYGTKSCKTSYMLFVLSTEVIARRCFTKNLLLKSQNVHRKTPATGCPFNKVVGQVSSFEFFGIFKTPDL